VIGEIAYDTHEGTSLLVDVVSGTLPGAAPQPLTDATVNFAAGSGAFDEDATCTGTVAAPTAPSGKVCIYLFSSGGLNASQFVGLRSLMLSTRGFRVTLVPLGTDNADEFFYASWAYTAP
jgi:hypothetical protein